MKLNLDSGIMRFLARITDLVLLQVLFLLTSLPIVTIGAGLTAMFAVSRKLHQDAVTSVMRMYFEKFKSNFKKGTIVWLVMAAIAGILYVDLSYYSTQEAAVIMYVSLFLTGMAYFVFLYIFPIMAWFENGLLSYFKNSLIMACVHLATTLLVTMVYAAIIWAGMIVAPLFFLCGLSGAVYITSALFERALFKSFEKQERS